MAVDSVTQRRGQDVSVNCQQGRWQPDRSVRWGPERNTQSDQRNTDIGIPDTARTRRGVSVGQFDRLKGTEVKTQDISNRSDGVPPVLWHHCRHVLVVWAAVSQGDRLQPHRRVETRVEHESHASHPCDCGCSFGGRRIWQGDEPERARGGSAAASKECLHGGTPKGPQ